MNVRGLPLRAAALAAWTLLPTHLGGQIARADVEAVLSRTVDYVLRQNPEGKYSKPVIVSARIDEGLALDLGIRPTDLTQVVSALADVPVWDGIKFCDTSMDPPHWRMQNADFRLSPTLAYLAGDTARVSVALSGSSSLKGVTSRTLELVRDENEWTPIGYVGITIHGHSVPCEP